MTPTIDLAAADRRIKAATWTVLPGRRAAHAMGPSFGGGGMTGACGQCRTYPADQLRAPGKHTRRCEQCLITLVSGVTTGEHKFMVGHVPVDVKTARRRAWRAWNQERRERIEEQ